MLVTAAAVLTADYFKLGDAGSEARAPASEIAAPAFSEPEVSGAPAALPDDSDKPHTAPVQTGDTTMTARMTFQLVGDGRLLAVGTIEPGVAREFAAEGEKRGSYVKTVVLRSPGGSVADALAMGRLIRKNRFSTEVEA